MKKKRTVFNGDSVVVDSYGEIHEPPDKSRIVIETYEEEDTVLFKKEDGFVKVFDDIIPKLLEELTPSELKVVIALMPYVSYTDCVIRTSKHGNSDIMSMKQIAEAVHMEYANATRVMSSLAKKGVVGLHSTGSILKNYKGKKNKVYTVNPYIYCRGIRVNRAVYDFYQNSGWREAIGEE